MEGLCCFLFVVFRERRTFVALGPTEISEKHGVLSEGAVGSCCTCLKRAMLHHIISVCVCSVNTWWMEDLHSTVRLVVFKYLC